jgi:beta-barrel assembly-enhancing protease
MGRIRGSRQRSAQHDIVNIACRLRREQGSSSIFNAFSLLTALVACFLFLGTAYCQAQNAASTPDNVSNPFATPWLLNQNGPYTPASRIVSQADSETAGAKKLAPAKYTLTPDPFNGTLEDGSPNQDVASRALTGTPQHSFAAESPANQPTKKDLRKEARTLAAKYDVSKIGDRGIGKSLNFYSIEKEQALGRELAGEVEQRTTLITDPVITEYVNRIGQTLVEHSDAQVPFTIKVVDDEQVNAFALPGGFFYVNSGLILAADNEAELAGVMAHEIAHVAARHATRNATKQEIWNLASLPLIFVGGPVGAAIREISGIAVPMSFLKFSRDAEREADLLGLEYQYAAGYDPTAFVDFFEKLESAEKTKQSFMARAFSTHPMNEDRVRRAEAELEVLPARPDYIVTTSEFDQVKSRLIQLTRGRKVETGKSAGPVLRKHTSDDDKPPVLKRPGT